ncbi:ketopantoate reductase family protein [Nocardiopsis aegyptia]|uniref:2-dehydropantoate 2-reductase n=1 Tax=Nocardiopsis aegyptia TaxID=220378 RepID=A0A7Z0EJM7_9ACTN|nr:ketopantoate reductase family protein [Nocardiopsis aegyptia]NYJ32425.1 2-dehydropantoate 2-reductase [Nocardiopsis aegyptia]
MRILVVGAGAVGGYFGARLVQAGRDVDFLVRPPRARLLAGQGLRLTTQDGDTETVPVSPVTADRLAPDYDLVIVAVKSYGLDEALKDLAPAVGPRTVVVPFLNGMRHLDTLVERFGADRVYGGVSLVQTRLDEEGGIVQVGPLAELAYGPLSEHPVLPPDEVHAALDCGGYTARASEHIRRRMWDKWVFLASLGACNCLMRAPVGRINSVPGGREFTAGMVAEAVAVATASGFAPSEAMLERTRTLASDTTATTTTSMYWDLTQGNAVEADHIIGDLVARGRELGVPTPLFSLAYTHLCAYSAGR